MARVPTVRKADLDRVLRALADAGLTAARVEIRPGGDVVIVPAPAAPKPEPTAAGQPAALTAEDPVAKPDSLDDWRARKRQRGDRAAQGS